MAEASNDADIVIVTSDNPRSENPKHIINDILQGFTTDSPKVYIEEDRKQAVHFAMELAQAGDTVLVAGKGHETYQQIGTTQLDYDDRCVIRSYVSHSQGRALA
jgi:UDP-N-acetylmuramoyl-L-alanyl-D-glutamate--2,6-diaminopimelate ligase